MIYFANVGECTNNNEEMSPNWPYREGFRILRKKTPHTPPSAPVAHPQTSESNIENLPPKLHQPIELFGFWITKH